MLRHINARPLALLALTAALAGCAATPAMTAPMAPAMQMAPAVAPTVAPTGQVAPLTIPTAQPTAQAAPAASATLGTLEFTAVELKFEPDQLTVDAPGSYTVKLHNAGALPHDITFDDGTRISANPGSDAEGVVNVPATGIGFICSIPGHKAAGMVGKVTVAGAAAAPAPAADEGGSTASDAIAPDPNAPPYELYNAEAPQLAAGTVHEITLTTEEKLMTVAPGIVQKVWTFGGTVPGPVIRVRIGDTVRIKLENPADSEMAHSVDFHASQVAWNDEMTSIMPGESKIYEFTADYAGVFMYHCGTAPALHHIANGMYGMLIVEPKGGLPPVDKEFALVQSEWYLGPQGEVSSLEKASSTSPAPDLVVFNGVANQYKDNPLQVGTGERVRFFVLNAGPNEDSSFHIVGTIFDSVTKEGVSLVSGNPGGWGAQAVDLSPAQGAIVELTTAEDGLYPIVTHAFNMVGHGALGLLQAGDGDPKN